MPTGETLGRPHDELDSRNPVGRSLFEGPSSGVQADLLVADGDAKYRPPPHTTQVLFSERSS
jgi:hypothetical protein